MGIQYVFDLIEQPLALSLPIYMQSDEHLVVIYCWKEQSNLYYAGKLINRKPFKDTFTPQELSIASFRDIKSPAQLNNIEIKAKMLKILVEKKYIEIYPDCELYENWLIKNRNNPCVIVNEFYLYSDFGIISGDLLSNESRLPFSVLNTNSQDEENKLIPRFILRYFDFIPLYSKNPCNINIAPNLYINITAQEQISCLLSLLLAIRLKSGDIIRTMTCIDEERQIFSDVKVFYNLPDLEKINRVILFDKKNIKLIRQVKSLKNELNVKDNYCLSPFLKLLNSHRSTIVYIIKAAKLYSDAIFLGETEPNIAFILLISAIESVAEGYFYASDIKNFSDLFEKESKICEIMQTTKATYGVQKKSISKLFKGNKIDNKKNIQIDIKFMFFLIKFMPNISPPNIGDIPKHYQLAWNDKEKMLEAFATIYNYRSRYLHDGTSFPLPMLLSPLQFPFKFYPEKPPANCSHGGIYFYEMDLPMYLYVFEYIVQQSIQNWWLDPSNINTELVAEYNLEQCL